MSAGHSHAPWGLALGFPIAAVLSASVLAARPALTPMSASPAPLTDLGRVPSFAGIDQRGQPWSSTELAGRVSVVTFIFTRCAGQCPMMASQLSQLGETFRDAPRFQLLSFTVDPEWDTPETLARYARQYPLAQDRWRLVTGEKDAIHRLSREGFKLGVSEDGTAQEPVTHSVKLVLVDPAGAIRGYYDAMDPDRMRQLRDDIRSLLAADAAEDDEPARRQP